MWTVNKATKNDGWIAMIHIDGDFNSAHMKQFVDLWIKLHDFHFDEDVEDTIFWTLTDVGLQGPIFWTHASGRFGHPPK
jgi:hypothetical protein